MHRLYDRIDKSDSQIMVETKKNNKIYETTVYKIEKNGIKNVLDTDVYYSVSEAMLGHQDYINCMEG